MLVRVAHVLLALVAANNCCRTLAQSCGDAWQRPCEGGVCNAGSILYKPANLCAACGEEAQFCCQVEGEWTCQDSSLTCEILPNPYDNGADGSPLGQARICVGSFVSGSGSPADDSGAPAQDIALTPEGQLTSETCPGKYQQCAGLSYEGVQNCCGEGLRCVLFNKWYSQCQEATGTAPSTPTGGTPDTGAPTPDNGTPSSGTPTSGSPTSSEPTSGSAPGTEPTEPGTAEEGCAKGFTTCAGENYNGKQNCCEAGYTCVFQNSDYSQCRPDSEITDADITPGTSQPTDTLEPTDPEPSAPAKAPVSTNPPAGERRVSIDTGEMEWKDSKSPALAAASEWKYPFDTMLGMSFFFYELQRAGPLPEATRAPWRGDSLQSPSGGNLDGERFQGGYFDAGDHNKFQLPTAYAVARLNWLAHAFPKALKNTYFDGRWNRKWAREAAKWGADFMAKSVDENQVLLHIGDIRNDHNYLGRAEYYPDIDRNILFCPSGKCSDVSGEIAASLAHAAVAFKGKNSIGKLSQEYWLKAVMAYKQTGADTMTFGSSNDVFDLLSIYYPSSGVRSHVFFAAASMWVACKTLGTDVCTDADADLYKAQALELALTKEADGGQKWFWEVPGWDNAWWDGAMLMAQMGVEGPPLFGRPVFKEYLSVFAQKWTHGLAPIKCGLKVLQPEVLEPFPNEPRDVSAMHKCPKDLLTCRVSPLGQRFTIEWGSNRFAASGAAIALMWANLPDNMRESDKVSRQDARCMAIKQLHYVAGDNDRGSYIAGFGNNPPLRNHHRNSVCAPWQQKESPRGTCEELFVDVINPANNCPSDAPADAQGRCYLTANRPNTFKTHGALIGGPKTPADAGDPNRKPYSLEGWNDWRTDWVGSEQTLDYNAHYTMALAAAIELPKSFWTSPCGGERTDLMLTSKAGLERVSTKYSNDNVYTFADFQEYSFTRTLPANWMSQVP